MENKTDELDAALKKALLKSCTVIETQEVAALKKWQNEASAVMARFINLSDRPDSDAWGETAIEASRLLLNIYP